MKTQKEDKILFILKHSKQETYFFNVNYNDIKYNETKNNKLNITNEYGEYWYIYIENYGFVGKNYGKDGKHSRNEFTPKYYEENNLALFNEYDHPDDEILETGNLQTLLGKIIMLY